MANMDPIQRVQEEEYDLPYHHFVDLEPFSQHRELWWGFRYAAYMRKMLDELQKRSFTSVVDIGCGDGKGALEMSKRFPNVRVVGTDYSEQSLRFARAFEPRVEFKTQTDERFDAFIMIEVLEHIPPDEMDTFLASVRSNLKDGGFGIITTPHTNAPLNRKHYQHFTRTSFEKTLEKFFRVDSFEYISARSWRNEVIQRLLSNRFFSLTYRPLVKALFRSYVRHCLHASEHNASQIFAVVVAR